MNLSSVQHDCHHVARLTLPTAELARQYPLAVSRHHAFKMVSPPPQQMDAVPCWVGLAEKDRLGVRFHFRFF